MALKASAKRTTYQTSFSEYRKAVYLIWLKINKNNYCHLDVSKGMLGLGNRKHFSCFYQVFSINLPVGKLASLQQEQKQMNWSQSTYIYDRVYSHLYMYYIILDNYVNNFVGFMFRKSRPGWRIFGGITKIHTQKLEFFCITRGLELSSPKRNKIFHSCEGELSRGKGFYLFNIFFLL